jgi:lysophospholipase L1-like esterase
MNTANRAVGITFLSLAMWVPLARAEDARPSSTGPANTAVVPVPKLENDSYDWHARHEAALAARKTADPEVVLIGDSITHFWAGEPAAKTRNGPEAWKHAFGDRRVLNLGFGWDRTQNVLWRLDHGEFDGLRPRVVVLNIGTNNFTTTRNAKENTPAEVAEAIGVICARVRAASPKSRVVVMGVFPRGREADDPYRAKIATLNELLSAWAAKAGVTFLDVGAKMLAADGSIPPAVMRDACHPTEQGYAIWAEALKGVLEK